MTRTAVIGGGIAGSAAAEALDRAGLDVVLYEASDRVGGKLRRATVGDVTLDVGAEAILARRPEGKDLIAQVGLAGAQVEAATTSASVLIGGRLRPMPRTVMGIPAEPTEVVTVEGRAVPVPEGDISVADYVVPRAGKDVLDRLVEPLLGGVYAGQADLLSLAAAAPQLRELGDDPIRAAAQTETSSETLFISLEGGVGRLAEEGLVSSSVDIRLSTTVRGLERDDSGWRLATTAGDERVDGVVLAVPAPAGARLLAEVAPAAAFELAAVEYASVAIATFVFDAELELPGSGFLVPPVEATSIKGATFSSNKWAWLEQPGRTVLRVSLGRYGETATLQYDDATLSKIALADLRDILGPLPEPAAGHVQRWGGALPQYSVGHLDRVAAIDADVAAVPGLEVCGAAYRGIGIPAVIASAQGAVARLLADLGD
jgi:oxygen-dependent protoporphyrinogen oxidase